ncbi:MAG: hypothetical protein EF813_04910 [Methanosarcinales archaeon]|nr:MAG: hypothetical protein EF813_04910 [Methanosarcinales archaeon]
MVRQVLCPLQEIIILMEKKCPSPISVRILTLLILIIMISSFAHAQSASAAQVSIPLPAVYATSEGEVGVLTDLTVWVTNGTGHVFVDTAPFTQVDMQGSARLSSMVACDITGINPETRDFFYVLHTDSPVIGGPSAGAAMTVATVAALMNWTIDQGVVMTGMINPDCSIGAVGGISAKLNASAKKGAHSFLIPAGQGNVTLTEHIIAQNGSLVTVKENSVTIDIFALGETQDIRVMEIEDLRDAILIYTGYEIPNVLLTGEVQTTSYMDAMQPLAATLLDESRTQYNDTEVVADTEFIDALESQVLAIKDAQADYDAKNYYASMSRSFNTMINLRHIRWYSECLALDEGNLDEYIADRIEQVENEISDAELAINKAKSENGVLEGIGAAESRLSIAREKLADAEQTKHAGDAIELLAFSMERARSAQWWATLSCAGSGQRISNDLIRDRAGRYYSQAASMLAYADALISETGGCKTQIMSAKKDLSRARNELHAGHYAGAIYDSLHAMVQANTAIELIGIEDLDEKTNNSEKDAISAIISARESGAEPILAVSAYEHAKILEPSQMGKIVDYGYATMVARTAQSFTGKKNTSMTYTTGVPWYADNNARCSRGKCTAQMPALRGWGALAAITAVYLVRRLRWHR